MSGSVVVDGFDELLELLRAHFSGMPPKAYLRQKLEAAFDKYEPSDLKARAFYERAVEEVFKELKL